jgi:hypothetical protein
LSSFPNAALTASAQASSTLTAVRSPPLSTVEEEAMKALLAAAAPIACAAALTFAATYTAPVSAADASAAAPVRVPRCATSKLVVWLDTSGNHAAGSTYYKLEFTNLSAHRCTLFGYPGVSAVDLRRHRLGSAAGRNPHLTPHLVSVASGASASAVLQITDAGVFPPSVCSQRTAAGLRVYPPDQTRAEIVPFPFRACAHPGPVYLHVEAVA